MPLQPQEIQDLNAIADQFSTVEKVRATDRVTQAQLAGEFVKMGNKVDPDLAQACYAEMFSMAVDLDQIPDEMVQGHCETIGSAIRHLLELAAKGSLQA